MEQDIPADLSADEKDGLERQQQGAVVESPRPASRERVRSSPLVRKIAKENNVDLAQVPGTGLGGRITKEDIEAFIAKHGAGAAQPAAPRQAGGSSPPLRLQPAPAAPAVTGPLRRSAASLPARSCPCRSCARRSPSTW